MLNNLLLSSGDTGEKLYVEDVFSTNLFNGSTSLQTITNNIDLIGKGGLVWMKPRSVASSANVLVDTTRGSLNAIFSDLTNAQNNSFLEGASAFYSTGFQAKTYYTASTNTYASWTFRKAPKFFDVVTWSGDDQNNRLIPHNLGVRPGFIIIKQTGAVADWLVFANISNTSATELNLNLTTAGTTDVYANLNLGAAPTSENLILGYPYTTINRIGRTYVAYLFAHDTTADGIVQCGSFTTNASGIATVNLGWEPQFLLYKRTDNSIGGDWRLFDNIRGWTASDAQRLLANTSAAETGPSTDATLNASGFGVNASGSATYIYLAIRRGPMRTPTDATKVYNAIAYTGDNAASRNINGVGFVPDWSHIFQRSGGNFHIVNDRLRGAGAVSLDTSSSGSEGAIAVTFTGWLQDGVTISKASSGTGTGSTNNNALTYISHFLRRAPGFFDIVCYTGSGTSPQIIKHNLGVTPEIMIWKLRSSSEHWWTYANPVTSPNAKWYQNYLTLNQTTAATADTPAITIAPTATQVAVDNYMNDNGKSYVLYLFASCPGVSKVGSYTGNGSSQSINCGFTNGARFVLIKRTDSSGDWFTFDTARGIVTGNDPHLSLNTTAAEVTTNDSIDPLSTGFTVNQVAATNVNVSGGTYLYLAIA